jgi:hypothetical protein
MPPHLFYFVAQEQIAEEVTAQPVGMIDNQDDAAILTDEGFRLEQTRTVRAFARHHVLKDLHDLIALVTGKFRAGALLRMQTVAPHQGLFRVRHAAIDCRFPWGCVFHG